MRMGGLNWGCPVVGIWRGKCKFVNVQTLALAAAALASGFSIYQLVLRWEHTLQNNTNLLIALLAMALGALALTWTVILGYLLYRVNQRASVPQVSPVPQPFVREPRPSLIGVNTHWKLHDAMTEGFDVSELYDLMFKLGVDEEWPTAGKVETVTKLIMWMYRRDRIGELYEAVREERPQLEI